MRPALPGASYEELAAAIAPTDPLTATDTQVADHADYALEYDSSGFVTKATIRGSGCSCGSGQGTFTYSYSTNSSWTSSSGAGVWRTSVKQTNPDGTARIVDVNGAGSIINDVFQEDATLRWIVIVGAE